MSTENTIKRDEIFLHDCVIIDFIHCQLWQILDFADGIIKLFSRLKNFNFYSDYVQVSKLESDCLKLTCSTGEGLATNWLQVSTSTYYDQSLNVVAMVK